MKVVQQPFTVFTAAAFLVVALAIEASAQPAPWYKWRSKVNGTVVCEQVMNGSGWEKVSGPYRDARCTKTIKK